MEVPSCDSPRGAKRPRGGGQHKKQERHNRFLSNSGIMAPRMNRVMLKLGWKRRADRKHCLCDTLVWYSLAFRAGGSLMILDEFCFRITQGKLW